MLRCVGITLLGDATQWWVDVCKQELSVHLFRVRIQLSSEEEDEDKRRYGEYLEAERRDINWSKIEKKMKSYN
ncbi:hypothetical protein E2C01_098606 [Portunus trituberculatus]|uniref:Uncharacterized protein n=1 Tax=Portunus trituberculatus TaxID=210409 RepID=A0A5B7K3D0_PORTR|nr:hypothetical protein [Portunus trituberculatus]